MYALSKKLCIVCNDIARTDCTSAIRASSIALGLHRPCIVILKRVARKGSLSRD